MHWSDLFASRHVRWLEAEIQDLKKRHEVELNRAITENVRLQGEVDRLRLQLGQPGTREPVEEVTVKTPQDPDAMPVFLGTPWEKVLQREKWLETSPGKRWMKNNLAPITSEKKEEETEHAKSG